jgi:hypothetical protein
MFSRDFVRIERHLPNCDEINSGTRQDEVELKRACKPTRKSRDGKWNRAKQEETEKLG